MDYHQARAILEWQFELGADEAIGDTPVDRYALEAELRPVVQMPKAGAGADTVAASVAKSMAQIANAPVAAIEVDVVAEARRAAQGAGDLTALRGAMEGFSHCELRRGAKNLVFGEGAPGARVMVIGEAPGRDEDREGRAFIGREGAMLDRMIGAIGLARGEQVYLAPVVPWRPLTAGGPKPGDLAMMAPFLQRHIELVAPEVIVVMGNNGCQAILGKTGISNLRGQWAEAFGIPVLAMFHPAHLLKSPDAKRAAWADLLDLQARLR